ncbi:ATP-dependent RNA helicase DHX36-like isoform X2 [Zootermopsis nevadensis]|uniref:ATP-dependent RNA helicase DHX36-like isoform X2 n=2 Tax=Zootermopsis nevadensis TaxID=136037 RepID=UPI000B8E6557|nr:ATP-dependent RNA helicase DHX36-like isoform X2 [Zootermopsis nevadensis]
MRMITYAVTETLLVVQLQTVMTGEWDMGREEEGRLDLEEERLVGLYYRDKARAEKQTIRIGVSLDSRKEEKIRKLLNSIDKPDFFRDKKCDVNSKTKVVGVSGNCYFSLDEKPKVKVEPRDQVGEGSANQDFSMDLKREIKLEPHDEYGEISGENTHFTRTLNTTDSDVKPGPSNCNKHGSSAADRYSHIGESSFKRKFLQNITGNIAANLERSLLVGKFLAQDKELDELFKMRLLAKQDTKHYQKMMAFRRKLPSFAMKDQILELVEQNQIVVISGETGCGKTTQVAQFILDDYIMKDKGSTCHVICTQPRRISAMSVATRVAEERYEVCGQESVGYQIRLERRIPRTKGSIVFCTTGVMLQRMQTDPALREVSHLVLDEIHERDVICDFVITILKDVIQKRPDLKVILMSATLNAKQFAKYYGDCPCMNIPGFTYPVTEYYLEDVLEMTRFEIKPSRELHVHGWRKHLKPFKAEIQKVEKFRDFIEPYLRHLVSEGKYSSRVLEMLKNPSSEDINLDLIAALIHHICITKDDGAILVFLPGWDKISSLHKLLNENVSFPSSRYLIIPLHSLMPTVIQKSVFDQPPKGVRKIIIATNLAETSITIDDVVYVIDCGKIKLKNFDVENNISTLKEEWVSLANSRQRRGRAGRVQPGECYHLYTRAREMALADYPLPEMLRTCLDEVILQIKILQLGKTKMFLERVMDPPDPRAVELSIKLLENLNALDADENLTPLGFHLARLPLDPQTGKMILMGALFSCVDPIFSVAASLSFKDAFHVPLGREADVNRKKLHLSKGLKSDHLVLAEALKQWEAAEQMRRGHEFCWEYFLSPNTLSLLRDMKGQFAEHLHEMNFLSSRDPKAEDSNINSNNSSLVKAIICAGLYPNVAVVRSVKRSNRTGQVVVTLTTPEDGRVCIHPRSINEKETEFESPLLLYHLKLKSTSIYLHDTTMVYPLPLLFFGQGVDFFIEDGVETIAVDKSLHFKCKERTANLVKELRTRLDRLLEYKITHPGTINWSCYSNEGAVLRAIIELITSEDKQKMFLEQEGDENFSD